MLSARPALTRRSCVVRCPGFLTWAILLRALLRGILTSIRVNAGDLAYHAGAIASSLHLLAWIGSVAALLAGLLQKCKTQRSLKLRDDQGEMWGLSGGASSPSEWWVGVRVSRPQERIVSILLCPGLG